MTLKNGGAFATAVFTAHLGGDYEVLRHDVQGVLTQLYATLLKGHFQCQQGTLAVAEISLPADQGDPIVRVEHPCRLSKLPVPKDFRLIELKTTDSTDHSPQKSSTS